MPDQKKPKVTIGPDGTIHVDNGDDKTPNPSGTPAVAKAAKSNSANASQKLNVENKVKSNAKMPGKQPAQVNTRTQSTNTSREAKLGNTSPAPQHSQQKRSVELDSFSIFLCLAGFALMGVGIFLGLNVPICLAGVALYFWAGYRNTRL